MARNKGSPPSTSCVDGALASLDRRLQQGGHRPESPHEIGVELLLDAAERVRNGGWRHEEKNSSASASASSGVGSWRKMEASRLTKGISGLRA